MSFIRKMLDDTVSKLETPKFECIYCKSSFTSLCSNAYSFAYYPDSPDLNVCPTCKPFGSRDTLGNNKECSQCPNRARCLTNGLAEPRPDDRKYYIRRVTFGDEWDMY